MKALIQPIDLETAEKITGPINKLPAVGEQTWCFSDQASQEEFARFRHVTEVMGLALPERLIHQHLSTEPCTGHQHWLGQQVSQLDQLEGLDLLDLLDWDTQ